MAVFDYVAIGADGKRASGVITADSARSARKELRLRQLSPLEVKEDPSEIRQSGWRFRLPVGHRPGPDHAPACDVDQIRGQRSKRRLEPIASEAEKSSTRRVLMGVRGSVQEGFSFSEALSQSSKAFPPYYRAVVSAGQSSGRLGDVMDRLATHLEKSRKLKNKLLSALIYPAVLACVAMLVVVLLLIFVSSGSDRAI